MTDVNGNVQTRNNSNDGFDETEVHLGPNDLLFTNVFDQKVAMKQNPLLRFFPEIKPYGIWKNI